VEVGRECSSQSDEGIYLAMLPATLRKVVAYCIICLGGCHTNTYITQTHTSHKHLYHANTHILNTNGLNQREKKKKKKHNLGRYT
jgi:hypothetical protein